MKDLYSSPDFTVICFKTEDNITQSQDNNVNIEDLIANS